MSELESDRPERLTVDQILERYGLPTLAELRESARSRLAKKKNKRDLSHSYIKRRREGKVAGNSIAPAQGGGNSFQLHDEGSSMNKFFAESFEDFMKGAIDPPFPKAFTDFYGYSIYLGSCIFPMSLISKSNHKGKTRHLSSRFRSFEDVVGIIARQTYKPLKLVDAWVFLEARYKKRVHIDYTNAFKSVLDGLVKGEVLKDDKYVLGCNLPFLYDKNTEENFTIHLFAKPLPEPFK